MYTIAWWLPFTKEKSTYQFQIVSKFAEIKIYHIILSPSLNWTIADLILTVLNQRWLIINRVQIWLICNMNILNLELLYPFPFTASYYTITHNYILNYSLNWY